MLNNSFLWVYVYVNFPECILFKFYTYIEVCIYIYIHLCVKINVDVHMDLHTYIYIYLISMIYIYTVLGRFMQQLKLYTADSIMYVLVAIVGVWP